jgi:hypothetical protein
MKKKKKIPPYHFTKSQLLSGKVRRRQLDTHNQTGDRKKQRERSQAALATNLEWKNYYFAFSFFSSSFYGYGVCTSASALLLPLIAPTFFFKNKSPFFFFGFEF